MKKPEEKKVTLAGPQGDLEAKLSLPEQMADAVAVVCHPHPLHGGTMHNKVVHYTARALLKMGAGVMRFNFRGVGQSEGQFDNAVGEVDDCLSAVEWLSSHFPEHRLILAGFSFGAYVATRAAARLEPAALITIAPAVNHYDFSVETEISCPWLLIQGDADEVVPPEAVRAWLQGATRVSKTVWMPGTSHFFHGRLVEMGDIVSDWMRETL